MKSSTENFYKFFKFVSYAVIISGLLSLTASGGVGISVAALFLAVTIAAWFLEETKWQLTERSGVVLIFLAIPLFYLDWKFKLSGFTTRETVAAGNLARLILVLAAIKLLQKKANRDWVFLYLISFFEVLLAAGLSISPAFLAALAIYLIFAVCAIVAFEIRKSSQLVFEKNKKAGLVKTKEIRRLGGLSFSRLPLTAAILLITISLFAVPLFFAFPRVSGSGLGRDTGGLSGFTGFSDSVRLGEIGRLQQSDEVVMRVRLDAGDRQKIKNFRWRGIALDTFENRGWRKSRLQINEPFIKTDKDYFLLDSATDAKQLVTQTVYLEPIDSSVLFSLSRPVAVQGNFQVITKDSEGAIGYPRSSAERLTYKVFSDMSQPKVEKLRADNGRYSNQFQRYLNLPNDLDEKISTLAGEIIKNSGAQSRYDQARAVENYLQTNFGYTLELKAGGDQPLSDFLFNVREGHCEYFATAMAVMLRTQGIATRIVNGFQQGEYNETAGVYVVRQKDAHSWVEVYFPKENVWMPFDPTPSAGQFAEQDNEAGLVAKLNKITEALETFWIQYVVAYDNQEQRSLFRSIKSNVGDYREDLSSFVNRLSNDFGEWWKEARGDDGFKASAKAIGYAIGYLLLTISGIIFIYWLIRKLSKLKVLDTIKNWLKTHKEISIVEFYERMQKILAVQGFTRAAHQTPYEFALALDMPEAIKITEKYNRVRFGEKDLTQREAREIEIWLIRLKETEKNGETK